MGKRRCDPFGEGILSDKNINTMFVDLMNGGYITLP
jgi:hypothetical protein